MILDVLAIICIVAGLIFFIGGGVGLVRFPDFYTRMHAAGKGDTLSSLLVILGIALHEGRDVVAGIETGEWGGPALFILKLLSICVFIMLTSPTSTHALIEAGYAEGIKPHVEEDELASSQQEK